MNLSGSSGIRWIELFGDTREERNMHDTELCKARTDTSANHCWHDTGVALMSYPAKTEQVCCWCGQIRHLQLMQWNRVIGNHGTNLPCYTKLDAVGTDGCKSAVETLEPQEKCMKKLPYFALSAAAQDQARARFLDAGENDACLYELDADGKVFSRRRLTQGLSFWRVCGAYNDPYCDIDALTERLEAMADEYEGHAKRNRHSAEAEKEDGNRDAEVRLATRAWMYDKAARKLRSLIEEMKG